MSAKVTGSTNEPIDIEVKRFYLPGIVVSDKCGRCGKKVTLDLGADYLSYPTANVAEEYVLYCGGCGTENKVNLILRVSVEVVP